MLKTHIQILYGEVGLDIMTWEPEELTTIPKKYNCEILFNKTTLDRIKDPSLPNDAYIVIYSSDDNTYMDLCRGRKVDIFDLYYDKFGSGSLKKIDWGYGRTNPKLWGYKKKEKKK